MIILRHSNPWVSPTFTQALKFSFYLSIGATTIWEEKENKKPMDCAVNLWTAALFRPFLPWTFFLLDLFLGCLGWFLNGRFFSIPPWNNFGAWKSCLCLFSSRFRSTISGTFPVVFLAVHFWSSLFNTGRSLLDRFKLVVFFGRVSLVPLPGTLDRFVPIFPAVPEASSNLGQFQSVFSFPFRSGLSSFRYLAKAELVKSLYFISLLILILKKKGRKNMSFSRVSTPLVGKCPVSIRTLYFGYLFFSSIVLYDRVWYQKGFELC